ncbi:4-oxalomesaconate tautomerase [Alphaproteobacteria bacterium]|nr:4-oxalomesaconate tautomerase [Alphaproteobacteria bacterium]
MQMRGGSSKGVYFLASDLPADKPARNNILKWVMGAHGDPRQIDGLGGADPLTSKIAIIDTSSHDDCDIDYTFIQALVGEDRLDETPNCGNLLSAVGAFALESGLLKRDGETAHIDVFMTNSSNRCRLSFPIKDGLPLYDGDARIDGVSGTSAPVMCHYADLAGSACGSLWPTGSIRDEFLGYSATCVDNGMPVVALRAEEFDISGTETPAELNANENLKQKLEAVRMLAGDAMGLGDVSGKAVPKMCLVSAPINGGAIHTRTFIPKTCHKAIGVLGAVSAATAAIHPDSAVHDLAIIPKACTSGHERESHKALTIEHPSGVFDVTLTLATGGEFGVLGAGLLRTARLLARGDVFVPNSVWKGV